MLMKNAHDVEFLTLKPSVMYHTCPGV